MSHLCGWGAKKQKILLSRNIQMTKTCKTKSKRTVMCALSKNPRTAIYNIIIFLFLVCFFFKRGSFCESYHIDSDYYYNCETTFEWNKNESIEFCGYLHWTNMAVASLDNSDNNLIICIYISLWCSFMPMLMIHLKTSRKMPRSSNEVHKRANKNSIDYLNQLKLTSPSVRIIQSVFFIVSIPSLFLFPRKKKNKTKAESFASVSFLWSRIMRCDQCGMVPVINFISSILYINSGCKFKIIICANIIDNFMILSHSTKF